ncbi:MAG: tetratricopeptide repeat protein [Acidobacteriia bacterium]|nr:tetratricopeptide repeat protein [Terriglobia bacterium]
MRENRKIDIQLYELAAVLRADELIKENKIEESLNLVKRAFDLVPRGGFVAYNLGVTFQQNRKFTEAISAYREALRAKPNFYEALVNLGNALTEHGEPEEAIGIYKKARQLDDKDADLPYNMGIAHEDTGQIDAALRDYQEAVRLNYKHILALFNLARLYIQKGEYRNAVDTLEKAHGSDSNNEEVRGLLNAARGLLEEQEKAEQQSKSKLD